MDILLTFVFSLIGVSIGSFLNVAIDRLPLGKSLIRPPSHCDACGRRLEPPDLVPVFSYIFLRGRCRYCRAPISPRVPWVEFGTGVFLALSYWRLGLSPAFGLAALYFCIFLVIGIIDLERGLILNRIVYPAAVLALIINVFLREPGIVDSLIGGAIGFGLLLIPALATRGGMGWGDVKMAALIGLVTGFPLVFVALLSGIILGGIIAVLLLVFKKKGRKEAVPFGPFLSISAVITILWGGNILGWYLTLSAP